MRPRVRRDTSRRRIDDGTLFQRQMGRTWPIEFAATAAEDRPRRLSAGDASGRAHAAARAGKIDKRFGNRRSEEMKAYGTVFLRRGRDTGTL
jgi:hypothetical protein